MELNLETNINVSAEKAWDFMGPQFSDIQSWFSVVHTSRPVGQGEPCNGRVCSTTMGKMEEQILEYDLDGKRIRFNAKGEKMPFFVKPLISTLTIKPTGPERCKASQNLKISVLFPFNILMGWMLKMQMKSMLTMAHEELKYVCEQGEVHPRKKAELAKQAAA